MSRVSTLVFFLLFSFLSAFVSSVSCQGVAESPIIGGGGGGSVTKNLLTGGPPTTGYKINSKQLISTVEFLIQATPKPNLACSVSAAFSLTGSATSFVNNLVVVPSVATFTNSNPSVNVTISTIPGQSYSGTATLQFQAQVAGCETYGGYSYATTTLAVKVVG